MSEAAQGTAQHPVVRLRDGMVRGRVWGWQAQLFGARWRGLRTGTAGSSGMPTETRIITFSNAEIRTAIADYCVKTGRLAPNVGVTALSAAASAAASSTAFLCVAWV